MKKLKDKIKMIKLKLVNPIGDILKEIEIERWSDIERFKAGFRFILESSDGSVYNYTTKEWLVDPPNGIPLMLAQNKDEQTK